MKFYISYFYQLRFFNEKCLPFSTAKWDPLWFHDRMGSDHTFVDKNGVINGLRIPQLVLPDNYVDNIPDEEMCRKNCPLVPFECKFMQAYSKYLASLPFDKFLQSAQCYTRDYAYDMGLNYEDISFILLVHEPKSCKCAERPCLVKWFQDNGLNLPEWSKENLIF